MENSILKNLAAKLSNGESAPTDLKLEPESAARLEDYLDTIAAAMMHNSSHGNNHRSSPVAME